MPLWSWIRKVHVKERFGKKYYEISIPPQWVNTRVKNGYVVIELTPDGNLLIKPYEGELK